MSKELADTCTLYLKTHSFHWNVEGPMSNTLHQMFMMQYTEGWTALDAIAERIRSLGFPLAEEAGDEATADLLTQRPQIHEKTAWMLRSLLR